MPTSNLTTVRHNLMDDRQLRAYIKDWAPRMIRLAKRMADLPYEDGRWEAWGFLFAINTLMENQRAVVALADVMDEVRRRPTYDEVLVMAERLLAMKREVWNVCGRHKSLKAKWCGPTRSGLMRTKP